MTSASCWCGVFQDNMEHMARIAYAVTNDAGETERLIVTTMAVLQSAGLVPRGDREDGVRARSELLRQALLRMRAEP